MADKDMHSITAYAEDAGWGRVQVTVRSIDDEHGGHHVLRLGSDGATWGWHPVTDGEDVFTFRVPESAGYVIMNALFAWLSGGTSKLEPASASGPSYKRLYEIEKDRADMLLDAVLKVL